MFVSQTIPRDFVFGTHGQAVRIHLGDERQMIGKRKVPDMQFHGLFPGADTDGQCVTSRRCRMRNVDFTHDATSRGTGQDVFFEMEEVSCQTWRIPFDGFTGSSIDEKRGRFVFRGSQMVSQGDTHQIGEQRFFGGGPCDESRRKIDFFLCC